MEEARRKLRVFLICVVMAAVLIGVIYYFTDVYGSSDVSEGTLVKAGEAEYQRANVDDVSLVENICL